jgi:Heparinase II/III-like protein/Heparinase II/III N-terminus
MTPSELVHRVRETSQTQLERIGLTTKSSAPGSFKQYLSAAPSERFYASHREPAPVNEAWLNRAVQEADLLLSHKIQLLHFDPVYLGHEIDWHFDPITGRTWERVFWTNYTPENDPKKRDSKIIHELNRQQHLPRLAKAYRWTGDERYAAEAVAQLESWIAQNPPGIGINWQSSLEIAIRSISWLWTICLLQPSRAFTEEAAQRIGDSLFIQLDHVHRHTSDFSSPNTHLIGEAAALFIAGLVFQDHKHGAAWMEHGAALLAQEADRQIPGDGVHAELSTYYHCYTADFYLQSMILAEHNHFPFPAQLRKKVHALLNFVMHIAEPSGTIPLLGDDDGGRALALVQRNYRSFNDGLALGAVLFDRSDFKHSVGPPCEEVFWLLGRSGMNGYSALESVSPSNVQARFEQGGYNVQRSGWEPCDSQLIFDTGGLGMLTGGHSHADALSITLSHQGRELLIDPGTSVYNSAPEWRSYFRSTRAHNTVTVDNHDQAEPGGTFRWKTRLTTTTRDSRVPQEYLEAEHDGYASIGVTHRRRILYIPGEYWIVADEFPGSGAHTFDFHYHFGPQLDPTLTRPDPREVIVTSTELYMAIHASQPVRAELTSGWISRGYGHREPAPVLRASIRGCTPTAMTFLVPGFAPRIERLQPDSGVAIACAYYDGPFKDIVVFSSGMSEVRVSGLRVLCELFWARTENGVVRKIVAIPAAGEAAPAATLSEDALCAPSAVL